MGSGAVRFAVGRDIRGSLGKRDAVAAIEPVYPQWRFHFRFGDARLGRQKRCYAGALVSR